MTFAPRYTTLVDDVITDLAGVNLIPEGITAETSGSPYPGLHRHEYIRTVQDVHEHLGEGAPARILEIGAFFGIVSIALARLGHAVTASDVPDYMDLPEQRTRFEDAGVAIHKMRLEDYLIDAPDESFDCIIMCEVLEHLNFNPLPLMKEINRVLRKGGLFYLSLPNQAQIRNRIALLRGRAVGIGVDSFFNQLDPTHGEIANSHWREYTMADIDEMLTPLGFDSARSYYFSLGETLEGGGPRQELGRLFYRVFPAFKENQTHLLVKRERTPITFSIPPTVHRDLRSL